MQHWDTENCVMIAEIWDLLRLDSLKAFHGHAIDFTSDIGDDEDGVQVTLPQNRFKLQQVHLDMSIVDAPGLTHLLSCCPDLEVLSIHWGGALQGDCAIWWDQFGTALRDCPSVAKLKTVAFDISDSDYYAGDGATFEVHPALGDLTSLSSLESLEVPAVALWGLEAHVLVNANLPSIVHTLPPALKRLGISSWGDITSVKQWVFDEREESEMGMVETLTADDRLLKNLEVLKVAGEGPMFEGSNYLQRWDVVMEWKADGGIETKRRMPIET